MMAEKGVRVPPLKGSGYARRMEAPWRLLDADFPLMRAHFKKGPVRTKGVRVHNPNFLKACRWHCSQT